MMEIQQIENKQPLNTRILNILVNLNPYLAENETLLMSYYKRVRSTWSNSAIKTVQRATGLKLTNKLNRCQFAIEAAKQELQFMQSENYEINCYLEREELSIANYQIVADLPSRDKAYLAPNSFQVEGFEIEEQQQLDTEENTSQQLQIAQAQIKKLESQLKEQQEQLEQKQKQLEQSANFSVLLLTNRLLAPGLPLNGTEESPAMRILGSPKTLTELEANYRELIKREHPDVSPFAEEEAINRFAYVRSLYRITREHWHCLKPTARITQAEKERRMKAPVPFDPKSFWAA
ncbi:MAG: J domain-containing protein [Xenococcaceae cyanobacterium]